MTTMLTEMETTDRPALATADLWKSAVALVVETHRMGVRRLVTGHAPEGADPALIRVSKAILDGPEYRAIARCDQRIRVQVGRLGLPISAYFKGATVIPVALLDQVEDRLETYQQARQEAVMVFQAAYPTLVVRAQTRLGPLFDPADYPPVEALPGLFKVSVQYLTFDMPGILAHCSERARRRAFEQGQAKLAEAVEEMQQHLRLAFRELIAHLHDRLSPDPVTGARKTLRAASVERVLEFLDTFAARNSVAADQELATLVAQVRDQLSMGSPADLRSDETFREIMRTGLAEVSRQLDQLLVTPAGRRYALPEDEADHVG